MVASLLPNGKSQFIDINGKPLVGGTVGMYVLGTLIPKNTWQDAGQLVLNTNPIVLDSRGQALIYGGGSYRQIVKDINGNLIWDEPVSAGGSIGPGGVTKTITVANSPYQMLATDGVIICDVSGGAIRINLLGATAYGGELSVKIKGAATNAVSVYPHGTDTIEESVGPMVLNYADQSNSIVSNLVSDWSII